MCELLGVTARTQYDAKPLLEGFYEHSRTNRDGWGLAVFSGRSVSLEKEPVKASDSLYLKERLSRGVESRNLFAHIRRASVGSIAYANCHPFVWDDASGRTWTMMHNGTLFRPGGTDKYADIQKGSTDSERLLLYIIEKVNGLIRANDEEYADDPDGRYCAGIGAGYADDPAARFRTIEAVMEEMSEGNKLNVLLYDGEYMYVHANTSGRLHVCRQNGATIFATSPVEIEGMNWAPVEICRLTVYKDGELVWTGKAHNYEHFEKRKRAQKTAQ